MTATTLSGRARPAGGRSLPLVLSLALREQRNGLSGFYVFIVCVALGVAVITGVGALADAMRASFESQGEVLLGGDVALSRPHQAAEDAERAWLLQQGRLSETATMRAMARRPGRLRAGTGRAQGRGCAPIRWSAPASFPAACPSPKRSARARRCGRSASCSSASISRSAIDQRRHDPGPDPRHHRGGARQTHGAPDRRARACSFRWRPCASRAWSSRAASSAGAMR